MFSSHVLKSAGSAAQYYNAKDNYYLKDKEDGNSQWVGKGAQLLGLKGEVDPAQFLALLAGKMPDGQRVGLKKGNDLLHKPGFDLTFSAPKSLSILALIGDSKPLMQAHKQAVMTALNKIESLYAETKYKSEGDFYFEKTKNMIFSLFLHTTSRELDPQLHTHAIGMNLTQWKNNQGNPVWKALSSVSGKDKNNQTHDFYTNILNNQHYIGMIYNSTLAQLTTKLGFSINIKDRYGNFDIVGIPDDYLKENSKRREQIKQTLAKHNVKGAKYAEIAAKSSREAKKNLVATDELRQIWKQEAAQKGVDLESIIQKAQINQQHVTPGEIVTPAPVVVSQTAKAAVDDAITHCGQWNAKITHHNLVKQAFLFSAGLIKYEEIEQLIKNQFDHGKLKGKPNEYYTTEALIKKEQTLIASLKASKGGAYRIESGDPSVVGKTLKSRDAIQLINTNSHQTQTLLQAMVTTAEAHHLSVSILNASRLQTQQVQADVKRPSRHLWQWVTNQFKPELVKTTYQFLQTHAGKKPEYVVVNDANKLSYQDITDLQQRVTDKGSKLILLNNTKATDSFSAGNLMTMLKKAGLTAVVDQQLLPEPSPLKAVTLDQSYHPLTTASQRYATDTTLVATSRKNQVAMNQTVREQRQAQGQLSVATTITTLSSESLSDVQKKQSRFYQLGDRVTFNPFSRQQRHYRVIGKTAEGLQLRQEDSCRKKGKFYPMDDLVKKSVHVTKQQTLDIAVGEQLVVESSIVDRHTQLEKGQLLSVTKIGKHGLTVSDGHHKHVLDHDILSKHALSYGYALRLSQLPAVNHHQPINKLVAPLPAYHVNKGIIGELQQLTDNVTLVTEDTEKATKQLTVAQITWTAGEVARGTSEAVKRFGAFAEPSIRKDLETVIHSLTNINKQTPEAVAETAVAYAMAKLGEREAAYSHKDLLMTALSHSIGGASEKHIGEVIEAKANQGELLAATTHWTTQVTVDLEKAILAKNREGQGQSPAILSQAPDTLPSHFTPGQKDAITQALTTNDRFMAVQGFAGVGKTTILETVKTAAEAQGYTVMGLAPTHVAVKQLQKSQINAMTIAKFLFEPQEKTDKTLYFVDECSMIGNQVFSDLQDKIIQTQGKGIFTGDIYQLPSVQSGKPDELSITQKSLQTSRMEDIVRQNPNPELKKAAIAAAHKNIKKAFSHLENINPEDHLQRSQSSPAQMSTTSVIEISDKKNLMINKATGEVVKGEAHATIYQAVADDYVSRIPEQRDNTLVIVDAHEDREKVATAIRHGLKQQQVIDQQEINTQRLKPIALDQVDLLHARHYQPGDILRFNKSYSFAKKDFYLTINTVDKDHNRLTGIDEQGQEFSFNPAAIAIKSGMMAYREVDTGLAKGDKIRLELTDKARGWLAKEEYQVTQTEANKAHVVSVGDHQKTLTLNLEDKKDQHWDYAYTRTAYGAQAATAQFVIALALQQRVQATTHKNFYIHITRASQQAIVYTDNKAALIARLSDPKKQKQADKLSAIEVLDKKAVEKPLKTQPAALSTKEKKSTLVDANGLEQQLKQQAEQLAKTLWGEPKKQDSKEMRWSGGLILTLQGDKAGNWFDFTQNKGGNCLSMIQQTTGLDFKNTLKYAQDFLGNRPTLEVNIKAPVTDKSIPKKSASDLQDYAKKLYQKSNPLVGSLAERYLKEHRQVNHYQNADIRFITSLSSRQGDKKYYTPALLAFAKDAQGKIHHAQVIRLDKITGGKDSNATIVKQTYGSINGHGIELNRQHDNKKAYITEGVETGLSILEVDKQARVIATLGKSNFSTINPDTLPTDITLCLDNDGKDSYSQFILDAAKRLQDAGKQVTMALPTAMKTDFNDVLMKEGKEALKQQLVNVMPLEQFEKIAHQIQQPPKSFKTMNQSTYQKPSMPNDRVPQQDNVSARYKAIQQQDRQQAQQYQQLPLPSLEKQRNDKPLER